jgi:hypothetical protein
MQHHMPSNSHQPHPPMRRLLGLCVYMYVYVCICPCLCVYMYVYVCLCPCLCLSRKHPSLDAAFCWAAHTHRVKSAMAMKTVVKDLGLVTRSLDSAMASMDLMQVSLICRSTARHPSMYSYTHYRQSIRYASNQPTLNPDDRGDGQV